MNGKRILVSGSIAYDYIMQYDGIFKDAILKEHLEHLNVAFTAKNRTREFGGCGGNIAYSLSLLGEKPLLYGVAGSDFDDYSEKLINDGVDVDFVGRDPEKMSATAYILTDNNENQITIFSPGAMESASCERALNADDLKNVSYAILSPDICEKTVRLAHTLVNAGVPYFFDPGQMTPAFSLDDLRFLLENAYGFIANHYEIKLLCERLGIGIDNIKGFVEIFIETLGEKGSILRTKDGEVNIHSVTPNAVVDPTGCGDAFRSGVLAGLNNDLSPVEACKKGSLVATYVLENTGTQSHRFTLDEFENRFEGNLGCEAPTT